MVSSVYLTELSRLSAFHLDSFRQLVSKCDCYFTLFCAVRYCTVFGQEPDGYFIILTLNDTMPLNAPSIFMTLNDPLGGHSGAKK